MPDVTGFTAERVLELIEANKQELLAEIYGIEGRRLLQDRAVTTAIAPVLPHNGRAEVEIEFPDTRAYRLYSIATSDPCRFRLYTSDAHRDDDFNRRIGADPAQNSGLVLEFISVPNLLTATLSPLVDGFIDVGNSGYCLIQNRSGSTRSVQVELTYIRTE